MNYIVQGSVLLQYTKTVYKVQFSPINLVRRQINPLHILCNMANF